MVSSSPSAPDLLVLGHVTRDEVGGASRLGGAAAYAARAAACLGVRTALLTAAPPDGPEVHALSEIPGLTVRCVPAPAATTFRLDSSGPRRRLWLLAAAPPLAPIDIPESWLSAQVTFLAPVMNECGREVAAHLRPGFLGAGLQGWLRRVEADGTVAPALGPEADEPPAGLRAAVLSEEDHPDAVALARRLAGRGVAVALTRGAAGATIFEADHQTSVAAESATELDPTGAGDVFGVVFTLAMARGQAAVDAARTAALAAARSVEGPDLGRLAKLGPSWWERKIDGVS